MHNILWFCAAIKEYTAKALFFWQLLPFSPCLCSKHSWLSHFSDGTLLQWGLTFPLLKSNKLLYSKEIHILKTTFDNFFFLFCGNILFFYSLKNLYFIKWFLGKDTLGISSLEHQAFKHLYLNEVNRILYFKLFSSVL